MVAAFDERIIQKETQFYSKYKYCHIKMVVKININDTRNWNENRVKIENEAAHEYDLNVNRIRVIWRTPQCK